MVIYREFKELKSLAAPVHWAMGMFDGVHLGHAGVIAAAVKGACLLYTSVPGPVPGKHLLTDAP